MIVTQMCEQATGCRGAGDFAQYARQHGYSYVEVFDWTSSVGDWSFIVSKDGQTWYLMTQENNYPRPGFTRHIYTDNPYPGPASRVLELLSEGW